MAIPSLKIKWNFRECKVVLNSLVSSLIKSLKKGKKRKFIELFTLSNLSFKWDDREKKEKKR